MAETRTVTVFGDTIEIRWGGDTWVSPSNGQQHARARAAMRVELERYFAASGEDVADGETAAEIDRYLDQMV